MLDRLSFRERLEGIRTARRTLLMLAVVNFAFLTLPLGAFFSVNALPAEIKKETALVSYEHKGSFDYLVYLKPSHLTGPADWEPAENPRYPTAVVESLEFTYNFKPAAKADLNGRIEAVLENPGVWSRTINMAKGTANGDLTLRFFIDTTYFKGLFDNIERELNLPGQNRSLTLKAFIDSAGDSFVQTLPIRLGSDLIEVDSNLKMAGTTGAGAFDYLLHLNSDAAVRTFPAVIVNALDFTFTYSATKPGPAAGWVDAVLENPGIWQKSIRMASSAVPQGAGSTGGNFILDFKLDIPNILDTYSRMEQETGITSSSRSVTLRADVTTGDSHFVQSLPITLGSTLVEVGNKLKSSGPSGTGNFKYVVRLKQNTIFNRLNIEVPDPQATPAPAEGIVFGPKTLPGATATVRPGEPVFPRLVDRMDVTFRYRLGSDKPLNGVATDVSVDAVIAAPKLWSKKFNLLEAKKSGDFTLSFPVALGRYAALLETLRNETGVSADAYDLTIAVNVRTQAETGVGKIDEVFTQSLKGTLKGGVLEWDKELARTQPGAIKESTMVPNPTNYLSLSVTEVKILSIALAAIFFLSFAFSLTLFVTARPVEITGTEKEAIAIKKKYGERLAEAKGPLPSYGEVITLSSMADLVTVADELGKPIIHQVYDAAPPATPVVPGVAHAYFVMDGPTRYQYVITTFKRM